MMSSRSLLRSLSASIRAARARMLAPLARLLLPGLLVPLPTVGADAVLPGTAALEWPGDVASDLVEGVDRFLLRQLEASVDERNQYWNRDFSSLDAYRRSIEPNREALATMLGVTSDRVTPARWRWPLATVRALTPGEAGTNAYAFQWPAFGDVTGEGLLIPPANLSMDVASLFPPAGQPVLEGARQAAASAFHIIAIPDADQTPEEFTGLVDGPDGLRKPMPGFALELSDRGGFIYVPTLISREVQRRHPSGGNRGAALSHREFLHRSAFELGRTLTGYEVQKVLALVDWISSMAGEEARIGVVGYGEGGWIALHAAALDTRIDATWISGYFETAQDLWTEPLDRNVFGLLTQFGDAELAAMVAPRSLALNLHGGPQWTYSGNGGAPASLRATTPSGVHREVQRLREWVRPSRYGNQWLHLVGSNGESSSRVSGGTPDQAGHSRVVPPPFLEALGTNPSSPPGEGKPSLGLIAVDDAAVHDRMARQIDEIDRHNQALLEESPYVRQRFMSDLDTSSPQAFETSVAKFRQIFRDDIIGHFRQPPLPANPRTRLIYNEPGWSGYEVVLDVFPDVIAYGILCVPKDIEDGERRPVVVCQHGLEGRPQDIITGDHRAYHDYAAKLAEQGFVTFSPQNLYLFRDRFRTLQRKANLIGKTLFSIIVPQHQQIVDWLETQPFVDPDRIAFYGLSYGGKTAMRVPPLVPEYKAVICSADFNDWVWKNASSRSPYSYVWTGEYEIFEFNLGETFNYAEMAALIAPRPFMVERGHFDGVAPDERVAYEFAKVRNLYQARLGIGDRCEIEWFAGPHTIHGVGTFEFLSRHLDWPLRDPVR